MGLIGHLDKRACTDWTPGENTEHYWGFVVADDRLLPIRLTARQLKRAADVASRNMGDCPKPPSKLEEWFEQALTGKDIKR